MSYKYINSCSEFKRSFEKILLENKASVILEFIKSYIKHIEKNCVGNLSAFLLSGIVSNSKKEHKDFAKKFSKHCLEFLTQLALNTASKKYASEAQAIFGVSYELGLFGLNINKSLAVKYYIIAAKQRNKMGTYRLAQLYEKEIGGYEGKSKAIYFYRCAAKLGSIEGMHIYGSILIHGHLSKKKDFSTGLFYLKHATRKANTDYPYPYYDLAQLYESFNTCKDLEPDDDYAFKLYIRGTNLECPNSQYRIAKCFENGELFQKIDMNEALYYYKKAADNGHVEAQHAYTKFLISGVDNCLIQNIHLGYSYALKAASQGHAEAAFLVGNLIYGGLGTKKNHYLALWWYKISASLGYKLAEKKVTELKLKLGDQFINRSGDKSFLRFILCL